MEDNNPYRAPNEQVGLEAPASPPRGFNVELSYATHAAGELTARDWKHAWRLAKREGAERVMPAVAVIFVAAFAYYRLDVFWRFPIAMLAAMSFILLLLWLMPEMGPLAAGFRVVNAWLDEAGIEFREKDHVWTTHWEALKGYKAGGNVVLLSDGKEFIPFSRQLFAGAADWQRFAELVRAKLPCMYSRTARGNEIYRSGAAPTVCSELVAEAHHDDAMFFLAFACTPEKSDLAVIGRANSFSWRHPGAVARTAAAVAFLLAVGAASIVALVKVIKTHLSDVGWLGSAAGVSAAIAVLVVRRWVRPVKASSGALFWRVGINAIQCSTDLAKHTFGWSFFDSWRSTADAVVLRRGDAMMWLFPRRCFEPDAWLRFQELVAANLGARADAAPY